MAIERNEFDKALRDLALRYAPVQIAQCGDVVTTKLSCWKAPHKVKVTSVAVEVSDIGLTIGRRAELGITGWLTVQYQYCGRRVNAKGGMVGSPDTGYLLSDFVTADGREYQRIPSGFNHVGLVFREDEYA